MQNLNKGQWVAVFVSIAFLGYLIFSGTLTNLINPTVAENNKVEQKQGFTSQDLIVGSGAEVKSGDIVTAHYVGTLADGKVFDSSRDRNQPIQFILGIGQVIRGWDEGVLGMHVGGKRILTISPEYAYGAEGVGPVPPNATLVFEVEVLDTKKAEQTQVE